jgi:glycosyltransferase involved in cell wall biosynthesis
MFESADPVDLARAIRRLYQDPDRRAQLVARATLRNERYRWPRQRAEYLRIVRRVLPRDPGRTESVLRSVE